MIFGVVTNIRCGCMSDMLIRGIGMPSPKSNQGDWAKGFMAEWPKLKS
jgi:hypothetical protein